MQSLFSKKKKGEIFLISFLPSLQTRTQCIYACIMMMTNTLLGHTITFPKSKPDSPT